MTRNVEQATKAKILDDAALDQAVGGGKTYTGGRFQLDVGSYNVGYLTRSAPSVQPATKP